MEPQRPAWQTLGFWWTWLPRLASLVLAALAGSGAVDDPTVLKGLVVGAAVLPSAIGLKAPIPAPKQ